MTVPDDLKRSKDTAAIGAAAEHYVMCQLLRRNKIAALAPRGVSEVDILVTDPRGNSLAEIQVKGRRFSKDGGWTLNAKNVGLVRNRLFYCFVDLGKSDSDEPKCWIIPSAIVSDVLKRSHQAYLDTPKKGGGLHKDWNMRRITSSYSYETFSKPEGWLDSYKDAWDRI